MDVSVIIVNYNTKSLLLNCLDSIIHHTDGIQYEIIVIDNNSSESINDTIKKEYPNIKLIESKENIGFGKANNLGAKSAKGKYLFLLNSDTVLLNNAIKFFYDFMHENENSLNIGALGCWLEDLYGNTTHSFGNFPTIKNMILYILNRIYRRIISFFNKNNPLKKSDDYKSVDFILGADLFINRNLFYKLNGFDPEFFMYFEETDLQKRMNDLQLERLVIPLPRIIHLEGGSTGAGKKMNYSALMMSQKSLNYYASKHFEGYKYRLLRSYIILERIFFSLTLKLTYKQRKEFFRLLFI